MFKKPSAAQEKGHPKGCPFSFSIFLKSQYYQQKFPF
jgi:hypothetical protein